MKEVKQLPYIFKVKDFESRKPHIVELIKEQAQKITEQKKLVNDGRDLTNQEFNWNKNFVGKIAEYATYALFFYSSILTTKPDLTFCDYDDGGIDMMCSGKTGVYNLHVKTCTKHSIDIFGKAWLFAKNDPLVNKPKNNDVIVLTHETEDGNIKIIKIARATDLLCSYELPKTAAGMPIRKKLKLDWNCVEYERDFKLEHI